MDNKLIGTENVNEDKENNSNRLENLYDIGM